jgi:hypothetical protein
VPALVGVMTALETFTHAQIGEVGPRLYPLLARRHGAVGQAWLRYLVDLGEAEIKAKLDQHRREWLAQPEIAELINHDPKDDSVLRRFALLAAALRMAVEAGLWPWSAESSDRAILACALRWAKGKDTSVVTLEENAAEQKLRELILSERDANRLVVLNKEPGGRGTFIPAPEHAVIYEALETFKNAGTLAGFIKVDGETTRILLYAQAFHRLGAACGLAPDVLAAHLQRAKLLEIKKEKVGGKADHFYVFPGTFLYSQHNEEAAYG